MPLDNVVELLCISRDSRLAMPRRGCKTICENVDDFCMGQSVNKFKKMLIPSVPIIALFEFIQLECYN